ncbi:MAG: hypothetical protein JKY27_10650 [Magnetovibrio sp.]|nr:hypothetical protein [Magnetovibrio sp.]
MLPSKSILTAALVGLCSPYFVAFDALAAQQLAQSQIAAAPPAFLRMDITSTCVDGGAVFKLINRGGKWPRTGNLRLY